VKPSPLVVVVFGLPGAGKTFVGRQLAAQRGAHFHDGDADLPADMRAAIDAAQPVTDEMRERFVDAQVARVKSLLGAHATVVLAQTFPKQVHRERFAREFPRVEWVLVTAPDALRAERIAHRSHQPLDAAYAKRMASFFDAPPAGTRVVVNDGVRPLPTSG